MSKHTKKSAFTTGVALAGFIGGVVVSAFVFSGFITMKQPPQFNFQFDSATTITVVLSALSIMITVLGIIIAVVGAFGFSILQTEAFKAGSEHAREQLGEDGELRGIIESRVDTIVAKLQAGRITMKDFPDPESEYGE